MRRRPAARPCLETLEDRNCPAVMYSYNGSDLMITGHFDDDGLGTPSLSIVANSPQHFTITDGTTTLLSNLAVPGSINIYTNDPRDENISIDLTNGGISGNLSVNTGAGNDGLSIIGTGANDIGGSVTLQGVNNPGSFPLGIFGVSIGRNLTINNAQETQFNSLLLLNTQIGGNFTYQGGNDTDIVSLSSTYIGGAAFVDVGNGLSNSVTLNPGSYVQSGLTIRGGAGDDSVLIDGSFINGTLTAMLGGSQFSGNSFSLTSSVSGNVSVTASGTAISQNIIDIGTAVAPAAVQGSVYLNLSSGVNTVNVLGTIGKGLTVYGGINSDIINLGDSLNPADQANIGGAIYFNLGDGLNTANFTNGVFSGGMINYMGGAGTDSVTIGTNFSLNRARVSVMLGAGDDFFELDRTDLSYLYLDFGTGARTFVPPPSFTFPYYIR